MWRVFLAAAVFGIGFVVAWNAAQPEDLSWPSDLAADWLLMAWLPAFVLSGLALRGRRCLQLPLWSAAAVATLIVLGQPSGRWEDPDPLTLAGAALLGVGALAVGQFVARVLGRRVPERVRRYRDRHSSAFDAGGTVVALVALAVGAGLAAAGRFDDIPEGPHVPAHVQAALGGGVGAASACYLPDHYDDDRYRAELARDRRRARRRIEILFSALKRMPDHVVTLVFVPSDANGVTGPVRVGETLTDMAEEEAEDLAFHLREGGNLRAETPCFRRLLRRIRSSIPED